MKKPQGLSAIDAICVFAITLIVGLFLAQMGIRLVISEMEVQTRRARVQSNEPVKQQFYGVECE